jgi:hypothetical protein
LIGCKSIEITSTFEFGALARGQYVSAEAIQHVGSGVQGAQRARLLEIPSVII